MKSYKQFITESKEDIDSICKKFKIENYTINSDGSVDVEGDVYLSGLYSYKKLSNIPLKFGYVNGNLLFNDNQLNSLEGCPKEVGGYFDCSNNELISLEGCPELINGRFDCSYNELTSLDGCPKEVGDFDCSDNELTSLEGGPKKVKNFDCNDNLLNSLVGCPEEVGGYIDCRNNRIIDFRGISEFFEGTFYCGGNQIFEIFEIFNEDIRCIKFINEFDVIRGRTIILDRLEEVFYQLGMEVPKNIKFRNYEII
jgi:hypothetical protein